MIDNFFDLIISNSFENVNHEQTLEDLIKAAKTIQIICPFISESGANWLLATKAKDCAVEIITELSTRGVISGVQSPEAMRYLLDANCSVSYVGSRLHG